MIQTDPVARWLGPVARAAALVCGWWLLAYCFLVVADIIGRAHFGLSLQGTDEIGGYTLAVMAAIGFSQALLARRHTRIELLVERLPVAPRALVHALAALSLAATAVLLLLQSTTVLEESLEFMAVSSSPLQVPMWVPQGAWVGGLALFALVAVASALQAVILLVRDHPRLNALYAPPTIAEDIEESIATSGLGTGVQEGESPTFPAQRTEERR